MRRHDKKVFFLAPERGSSREEDTCGSACFLHAGPQSCEAEAPCFAVSKAPVSIQGNGR